MKYVYIGRFQPFHKGHKAVIDLTVKMMKPEDTFTIIIGSADQGGTEHNPLWYIQRVELLQSELKDYPVTITTINDSPYDYDQWVRALCIILDKDSVLSRNTENYKDICIVGMENVPEYVRHINDFFREDTGIKYHIFSEDDTNVKFHGSTIRQLIKKEVSESQPETGLKRVGLYEYSATFYDDVKDFVSENTLAYMKRVGFQDLVWDAFAYSYKYALATGCKYNSCFVTVDNIVYDKLSREVLLIKRKDNGKLAIPGGFAEPYMDAKANALRELEEETSLTVDDLESSNINLDVKGEIIDAPYRDPRSSSKCNFISIVYIWQQENFVWYSPDLRKKAKAGDDAAEVLWLTQEQCENLPAGAFHADHKKILCKLLHWNYFIA